MVYATFTDEMKQLLSNAKVRVSYHMNVKRMRLFHEHSEI